MKTNKDFEMCASYEMLQQMVKRWYNLDPDVRLWIMYYSDVVEQTAKEIEEMLRVFELPGVDVTKEEGWSMPSEGVFEVDNELKRMMVIEALKESRRFKRTFVKRTLVEGYNEEITFGENQVSES